MPRLKNLRNSISRSFQTRFVEVSNQPEIVPLEFSLAAFREFLYWRLSRRWKHYCLTQTLPFCLDIAKPLKHILKRYVFTTNANRTKMLKHGFIETIVTAKHIRVWEDFIQGGEDLLICFEDDVIFKDNSEHRLINWLIETNNQAISSYGIYVDLAGGCAFEALHIDKLQYKQDDFCRYFSKPVTNTACCYAVSRSVVSSFLSEIEEEPDLRLIGVDWLMNQIFIKSEEYLKCKCIHTFPSIFRHGSFTGQYLDWRQADEFL